MRPTRQLARLAFGASATAGLVLSVLAAGPAPAAEAQSNVRICAAWNSAVSGGLGTGLVVKVYKNGSFTCDQKLEYMYDHYGEAYQGSSVQHATRLMTCEDFAGRIGYLGDPCYQLTQNAIYEYSSRYDYVHPVTNPGFSYWRS
ncbi:MULTISPECIES: hypothetical protein [Clavibacter]|uniref:Secreted protein n=1 Tax=Clavibacter tessellarius TaxID=31965 RepID=A0A154V1U2_9MICO|nr:MULTISPECIES: hypothetical protein [Clavibacter]KZC95311.1 hypothetical protein AWH51_09250 [Clavibacter michiganensis subsp. tessellarius]MDA3803835.1 hypothetical protein [Clavibacter sp. CT19]